MGKSRGGKYGHKPRERVQRLGPRGEGAEEDEESSEEEAPVRQKQGQSSTVGLLPPSDSESEEEGSEGEEKPSKKEEKGGQSSVVGQLPPSDSEDSDSDSDGPPMNEYLTAPSQKKKQANAPVERSPEDIRKEMERLQIVKKKREEDRIKRIAAEGWDRFQPMSETNRPPGSVPSDHPTSKS
ncbi:hypothetical protein DUNSADRAFT_13970 [Dunaliella salina]|uniref:Casein kinase substrate phosphoprotein PP28 domain-containing protein n=1 Tax=Dunaliella salina TaxID=3046 RepID=A0ABQ7G882_DUNSA|nr:hypothetical protein DUNSADRAFT_13970 [Dunaliella salina]|eukprot:KAF5830822.1 hypothetical protein DUNSADRAFT_13970 [Dunaliella salina]